MIRGSIPARARCEMFVAWAGLKVAGDGETGDWDGPWVTEGVRRRHSSSARPPSQCYTMSGLVTDKQENDHQHWRLRRCLQSVAHFLNHAPRCGFISNSLFSKCLDFSAAARSSGNLTKSFIRISKLIKTYLHLAFMIWWSCCCLMFALIGEWWLSEPENRQALRMKISDCVSDSRSRAQNKERRGEERSDPGSECGPEYPDLDIIREE